MMEHLLAQLFDRQKFEQNTRLASIISDVESRYSKAALSVDELDWGSAAGDPDVKRLPSEEPL